MHSIEKDLYVLLNLLIAHQILEIAVGVVTFFSVVEIEPGSGFGLSLVILFCGGFTCHLLLVNH